jgi:hypothetical protein
VNLQREIIPSDYITVMEMSKKLKMNLPDGASFSTVLARCNSIEAYHLILDTITKHGVYVGNDGKGSTSMKGFVIQINRKIKSLFGMEVKEIKDEIAIDALTAIRKAAARAIQRGEKRNLPRSEIKANTYNAMEDTYNIFM